MKALELFAGAGGLAMGVSQAGFDHEKVIEKDAASCNTLRFNRDRGVRPVSDWSIFEGDIRTFDYAPYAGKVDLISGGPPCQPFSLGGKHRGQRDHRDMFPEAVRAVRAVRPRAFLFENVKGLLRESFSKYFEYILLQLNYPEVTAKNAETWMDHLSRLERYHTRGKHDGLSYRVVFRLLNAADYGVPQKRERVFMAGFRSDVDIEWSFPAATHSEPALWWSKWNTGEYWERHAIARKRRGAPPDSVKRIVESVCPPREAPWLTVRDVIGDLPAPQKFESETHLNHVLQPGARPYPGHTGSPLDEPAKTLKAGDHGVPGGENMIVLPDASVRYLTVRESARIQTFPDDYGFRVSWTESMRQIGNAVPMKLAQTVADHMNKYLAKAQ